MQLRRYGKFFWRILYVRDGLEAVRTGLRAVQTALKPSVRTNVVTKPSGKPAAKPSLPVEYDAVRDPSHSDPLQGYK